MGGRGAGQDPSDVDHLPSTWTPIAIQLDRGVSARLCWSPHDNAPVSIEHACELRDAGHLLTAIRRLPHGGFELLVKPRASRRIGAGA